MKFSKSTCSYWNLPIKSINFKSYLTWPGFELKTVWKKTPLRAFTNWAIGTDKKWDNFWNLWAWESERKREKVRERECAQAVQYIYFEHPPPPSLWQTVHAKTYIITKKTCDKKGIRQGLNPQPSDPQAIMLTTTPEGLDVILLLFFSLYIAIESKKERERKSHADRVLLGIRECR